MPTTATKKAETPEATEPAETTGTFEVIYKDITLAQLGRGELRAKAIYGDVARLADGTLLARVQAADIDGSPLFAYEPFDPDPISRRDFSAQPVAEAERFNRELENMQIASKTFTLQASAYRAEVEKFKALWPELTIKLGLEADRPNPIFDPGAVFYPVRPKPGCWLDMSWVRTCVDLHASGDWGDYGVADLSALSDEERWCASILPRARRNIAFIRSGSGIVESQYALGPVADKSWNEHHRHSRGSLRITTLIRPGAARTLARITTAEA
jgi:hypothetical protein